MKTQPKGMSEHWNVGTGSVFRPFAVLRHAKLALCKNKQAKGSTGLTGQSRKAELHGISHLFL
jgi:hypothetical protein